MYFINKIVRFLAAFMYISMIYFIAGVMTFFVAFWDWNKAKAEIKSWEFWTDVKRRHI